jgi:hypothetical protein
LTIHDKFWSNFIAVAKSFPHYRYDKEHNKYELVQDYDEADLYDVFNTIREKVNGGWTYTSKYIDQIDQEILEEEQREYARSFGVV